MGGRHSYRGKERVELVAKMKMECSKMKEINYLNYLTIMIKKNIDCNMAALWIK